jgi:hypothetical protein
MTVRYFTPFHEVAEYLQTYVYHMFKILSKRKCSMFVSFYNKNNYAL